MTKKIIFSTGGTGGHIFPAINLMKHFFGKGYKVVLVTDTRGNLDLSAGVLGFSKQYFGGVAVHHLTQPNEGFINYILISAFNS